MKKYISAILIPSLLLQLCCCISSRPIALNELENEKEAIIVTKDSTVYKLNAELDKDEIISNPDIFFAYKWQVNADSSNIKLNTQKANKESSGQWGLKEEIKNICLRDILSVTAGSDNSYVKLVMGITAVVGVIVFTILIIVYSEGPAF